MLEALILGIIQGIGEWLPVSSEGLIVIVKTNFFPSGNLEEVIRFALFLHLGTFLSALIYFRREVWRILRTAFYYRQAELTDKKIFWFLFFSTLVSGVLGFGLLKLFIGAEESFQFGARTINLVVGVLLLITAYLQFKKKYSAGLRDFKDLSRGDWVALGLVQAFSSLPGLSRSGLTVAGLLLRKFREETALTLSFLMSMPIVVGGNIFMNLGGFKFGLNQFVAMVFSFIFGLLTIHLLLKLAKRINFGFFVLFFGLFLVIVTLLI